MTKIPFHKAVFFALPLLGSFHAFAAAGSADTTPTHSTDAKLAAEERAKEHGIDLANDPGVAQDAALRLAEQHLALRNIRWGKPIDVREEGEIFVLSYETPDNETRLVGKRTVTVRKADGLVKVRERR